MKPKSSLPGSLPTLRPGDSVPPMICPVCPQPLGNSKLHAGVLACRKCRGHCVGLAFLNRVYPVETVRAFGERAETEGTPSAKGCPQCSKSMRAIRSTELAEPIELDVCRACYLIWFDRSEYEKTMRLFLTEPLLIPKHSHRPRMILKALKIVIKGIFETS